jgi:hypothetical protein
MPQQPFDLNDIIHEPSDEQLDDADGSRCRSGTQACAMSARAQLMLRLRAEITAINLPFPRARHDRWRQGPG